MGRRLRFLAVDDDRDPGPEPAIRSPAFVVADAVQGGQALLPAPTEFVKRVDE